MTAPGARINWPAPVFLGRPSAVRIGAQAQIAREAITTNPGAEAADPIGRHRLVWILILGFMALAVVLAFTRSGLAPLPS